MGEKKEEEVLQGGDKNEEKNKQNIKKEIGSIHGNRRRGKKVKGNTS